MRSSSLFCGACVLVATEDSSCVVSHIAPRPSQNEEKGIKLKKMVKIVFTLASRANQMISKQYQVVTATMKD